MIRLDDTGIVKIFRRCFVFAGIILHRTQSIGGVERFIITLDGVLEYLSHLVFLLHGDIGISQCQPGRRVTPVSAGRLTQ